MSGGGEMAYEYSGNRLRVCRTNDALEDYSVAAGRRAKANSYGCFVWADSTDADVACDVSALLPERPVSRRWKHR